MVGPLGPAREEVVLVARDQDEHDVAATHPAPPGQEVESVLDRRVGPRRREGGTGAQSERCRSDGRVNQDAQARLQSEGFVVIER